MLEGLTRVVAVWGLSVGLLAIGGCGEPAADTPTVDESSPSANAASPTDASPTVEVTEEMAVILAKADEVDGSADKTVSKCAVCSLGMDGSSENALAVGEYTLHFCSADCKSDFAQDTAQSVLAIKLPSEEKSDSSPSEGKSDSQ